MRLSPAVRAFTLIELMVVLLIIAILAAVSITVATRVTEGGKTSATQNIIRTLDSMLTSYSTHLGGALSKTVVLDPAAPASSICPLVDGRVASRTIDDANRFGVDTDPAQPAATLLLMAMERDGYAESLKSMDAKFVKQSTFTAFGWAWNNRNKTGSGELVPITGITGRQVVDAWGRAIRFVHPAYDGGAGPFYSPTEEQVKDRDALEAVLSYKDAASAQAIDLKGMFSRSYRPFDPAAGGLRSDAVGDADEGVCPGNAAYFYSAGSDADPGTREDNVYTTEPTFPPTTKDFN